MTGEQSMIDQMDTLNRELETRGIECCHGQDGCLSFDMGNIKCIVFPSKDVDGKIAVFYQTSEYVDTSDDVLRIFGLM